MSGPGAVWVRGCVAAALAVCGLVRSAAAWDNTSECLLPPFGDTPPGTYACTLVQDQVSTGCGGGNYCPALTVSRAQAAMFLERSMRGTTSWSPARGWSSGGASPARAPITVYVSPVPGDPLASGQEILTAFGGILDAAAGQPYLVKLEPGLYDMGSSPLAVESWVDLEGSGEGVTRIVGQPPNLNSAIVMQSGHTEIRSLTIGPAGPGGTALGEVGDGPRAVRDLTIDSGAMGVNCYNVPLRITRASIAVQGGNFTTAVGSTDCALEIEDSELVASGGGYAAGLSLYGNATLRRTVLRATGGSNYNHALQADSGLVTAEDVEFASSGVGSVAAYLSDVSASVRRSEIHGGGGFALILIAATDPRTVAITGSRIASGELTVDVAGRVRIAESQLDGVSTFVDTGGSLVCYKTFDGAFTNANGVAACP